LIATVILGGRLVSVKARSELTAPAVVRRI